MRKRIGPLAACGIISGTLAVAGSVSIALIAIGSASRTVGAERIGWLVLAAVTGCISITSVLVAPSIRKRLASRLRNERRLAASIRRLDNDVAVSAVDEALSATHEDLRQRQVELVRSQDGLTTRIEHLEGQLSHLSDQLAATDQRLEHAVRTRRADVRIELTHATRELAQEVTDTVEKLGRLGTDPFAHLVARHLRRMAPCRVLEIGGCPQTSPVIRILESLADDQRCELSRVGPEALGKDLAELSSDGLFELVIAHPPPFSSSRSQRASWYDEFRPLLAADSIILLADPERDRTEVLERWARDPLLTPVRSDTHSPPADQGGLALAYRRSRDSVGSGQRVVLVKGRFGMGGRLAVLASAVAFAERTGRRLVVDWNDPAYWSPGGPDVYPALFDAPACETLDPIELIGASVDPPSWQQYLEQFTREEPGRVVPYELSFVRPPHDDVAADVVVITRDDPQLPDLRGRLRELKPSQELLGEIDNFAKTHFGGEVIGVHVRHGNGEFLVDPPDLGWFVDRISAIRTDHPDAPIFLATDSPIVVDDLTARFERVVTVPKWYPAPSTGSLHHHKSNPDPLRSAGIAVVDIWLLARCHHLVLSRGGFSRAARMLSDTPDDRVSTYPRRIHASRETKRGWANPP